MLRRLALTFNNLYKAAKPQYTSLFTHPIRNHFTDSKPLTPATVPPENLKVTASSATVGGQTIDYYRTEGGISILDKVPGVKADNGELYVLSFRCNKCNTQSIRSFTKHAYHKGVVLVRCGGCPHTHLVADNLGWFQDEPVNIETMHKGQVKKVHDHVAIVKFLQTALGDDSVSKQSAASEQKSQRNPTQKQE